MAEQARRRSALAAEWRPGRHGAEAAAVGFEERRSLALAQVECDAAEAAEMTRRLAAWLGEAPPEAGRATGGDGGRLVRAGPWRWLAVAAARPALAAELGAALAGADAAVVDLSGGRCVLRMRGHEGRYVLAKGCGLNVHPRVLHAGRAAQTALFGIDVLIDAVDEEPAFDLYVGRSLALSLWQALRHAATEYGYRVA